MNKYNKNISQNPWENDNELLLRRLSSYEKELPNADFLVDGIPSSKHPVLREAILGGHGDYLTEDDINKSMEFDKIVDLNDERRAMYKQNELNSDLVGNLKHQLVRDYLTKLFRGE